MQGSGAGATLVGDQVTRSVEMTRIKESSRSIEQPAAAIIATIATYRPPRDPPTLDTSHRLLVATIKANVLDEGRRYKVKVG